MPRLTFAQVRLANHEGKHTALQTELTNQVAVVTGASAGIGRTIAHALGAHGATVCLVGRRPDALDAVRGEMAAAGASVEAYVCDLAVDRDIAGLRDRLALAHSGVDILVHSAGVISLGPLETMPIGDFDQQYQINVRAPYLLTQALLPLVKSVQGQIVFINSSVAVHAKENTGAYAASKHALRALADMLRMEVNSAGVRVLSVYPGSTATPMQEHIQEQGGRRIDLPYLLQPDDIASVVVHSLLMPRSAEVTDIHIRPFRKQPG